MCRLALNFGQALLSGKGGGVILRMLAQVFAEGQRGIGRDRRIEADEQRLVVIDALQRVHPVGHGDVVIDAPSRGQRRKFHEAQARRRFGISAGSRCR